MCSPLQTEQKYRDHNKPSKKQIKEQTKNANCLETTTNQGRDKLSENIGTTTTLTADKINWDHWHSGQKWRPQQTEQKYRDHNNHNTKRECRNHNKTDTRQDHSIKATEIQTGSNTKPGSRKFMSFLLLIDKFSHFKWPTITLLIKINVVVDEKKSRKN